MREAVGPLLFWKPSDSLDDRPQYIKELSSPVLFAEATRFILSRQFLWQALCDAPFRGEVSLLTETRLLGYDLTKYCVGLFPTTPLYYYNHIGRCDDDPLVLERELRARSLELSVVIRDTAFARCAAFWMFDSENLYPLNTMLLKCQACGEAYYTHAKRPRTRFRKCLFDPTVWTPPQLSYRHHYSLSTLPKS